MVMVPPLLADLIRHGLSGRVGPVIAVEFAEFEDIATRLREFAPDVVIVGPSARPFDAAALRALLPEPQILAVSRDLSHLVDLDTSEDDAFTPDALADRLRRR
jgi:hypothetical protein